MAYCYKCGKPLIDGDRFCTHCGTEQPHLENSHQQDVILTREDDLDKAKIAENNSKEIDGNFTRFAGWIRKVLQATIFLLSLGFLVVLINCFLFSVEIKNKQKGNSSFVDVEAICHPMLPYYSIKDNDFETFDEFKYSRRYREDSPEEYSEFAEQLKEKAINSLRNKMIKNMLVYILWIFICGILMFILKHATPFINKHIQKK